jgi:probable HAF family extracellular repeat protein
MGWLGMVLAVSALAPAAWGAPARCRATELEGLGGRSTRAAAISREGTVAGSADGPGGDTVAVVFREGMAALPLGSLGGVASAARGVGARERVVGSAEVAPEVTHAFLWEGGRLRDLGALGDGRDAAATAVHRRGEVVGYSQIGRSNATPYHGFLVRNGRMLDLGAPGGADSIARDINDWGMIVGSYGRANGSQVAFLHWDGAFMDLGHLGGGDAEAYAINQRGQIVGTAQTADGQRHAFRWYLVMRDLGTLGGTRSLALGLNEAGDTVGTSDTADGSSHAFLVKGEGPMVDLHALAAPEGVTLIEAVGIDETGRIAAMAAAPTAPSAPSCSWAARLSVQRSRRRKQARVAAAEQGLGLGEQHAQHHHASQRRHLQEGGGQLDAHAGVVGADALEVTGAAGDRAQLVVAAGIERKARGVQAELGADVGQRGGDDPAAFRGGEPERQLLSSDVPLGAHLAEQANEHLVLADPAGQRLAGQVQGDGPAAHLPAQGGGRDLEADVLAIAARDHQAARRGGRRRGRGGQLGGPAQETGEVEAGALVRGREGGGRRGRGLGGRRDGGAGRGRSGPPGDRLAPGDRGRGRLGGRGLGRGGGDHHRAVYRRRGGGSRRPLPGLQSAPQGR